MAASPKQDEPGSAVLLMATTWIRCRTWQWDLTIRLQLSALPCVALFFQEP